MPAMGEPFHILSADDRAAAEPDALIIDPDRAPLPTVADLLAQSRAQHAEYRRRDRGRQHPGDCLADALRLRLQAHDLDPQHTDQAWLADRVSHDELVTFYATALGRLV